MKRCVNVFSNFVMRISLKVYINEIIPWINEMQNNLKCNSLQQFRISNVKEM